MSQIVTRKGPVNDDKEKRQTDSPVKDMKKKVAANAEKEKQADKPAEKTTDKPTEKKEKALDKTIEKKSEKKDSKSAEKPVEQKAEKSPEKVETKEDVLKAKDDSKGEKSDKADESKKPEAKPKQNGQPLNGAVHSNGNRENGTVSSSDEEQSDLLVIEEQDELFPELAYEDGSDGEAFEPPTPESGPSRSLTRRAQAVLTRTPETPRPASVKQDAPTTDDSKEPKDPKTPKPKEDTPARKLRSSDSPKPQDKKEDIVVTETTEAKSQEPADKIEADVVIIDVEVIDDGDRRKTDTNFSKSRVKVSPYRRSLRLDNTTSSVAANYTGNNTTMEMDISEPSLVEDNSLSDSYLSGLRQIRGRRSYRTLGDVRKVTTGHKLAGNSGSLSYVGRPTVTVVGRKRKPDNDATSVTPEPHAGKRARVFDRIAMPFRRAAAQAAPAATEIIGVNTDLPLTTHAIATEDPESIKQAVPLAPVTSTPVQERERKCIIM